MSTETKSYSSIAIRPIAQLFTVILASHCISQWVYQSN